jgi:hypothetical protein
MTKKDKNEPMIFRRKRSKERKISEMGAVVRVIRMRILNSIFG